MPFDKANVSIASSPVLYGLSIYSVFNAVWDEEAQKLCVFRLQDHYGRLVRSARIMDFHNFLEEWPYERFKEEMFSLLSKNTVKENVLVRVSVFVDELIAGTRIHGLKNSLSAYVYPMGEILPRSGAHLCVSSWRRSPDNSIPSRAKVNGSYINASLMKNEALLNGYDDAIAIDEHGHITEGTVANIFLVRDGRVITPGQSADILEGITRATILRLADDLGMETFERSIDRSELYICDEAFLTGSSANLTPVLSIDRRSIGKASAGPLTRQLAKAYREVQRISSTRHPEWLEVLE